MVELDFSMLNIREEAIVGESYDRNVKHAKAWWDESKVYRVCWRPNTAIKLDCKSYEFILLKLTAKTRKNFRLYSSSDSRTELPSSQATPDIKTFAKMGDTAISASIFLNINLGVTFPGILRSKNLYQ
jgi:hypothetical protein